MRETTIYSKDFRIINAPLFANNNENNEKITDVSEKIFGLGFFRINKVVFNSAVLKFISAAKH